MIHIFKHTRGKLKGKFDVACVARNGTLIYSTAQGFERKSGVYKNLRATAANFQGILQKSIRYQDDTVNECQVFDLEPGNNVPNPIDVTPVKPYKP